MAIWSGRRREGGRKGSNTFCRNQRRGGDGVDNPAVSFSGYSLPYKKGSQFEPRRGKKKKREKKRRLVFLG